MYPNPVTNANPVTFEADNLNLVEIYNSTGQKVYQNKTAQNSYTISSSSFKPGLYVVKFNGIYTEKLVVK